jgi:SAM-dependent methyltransferase
MLRGELVIDRSLNYGRSCMRLFLERARPYHAVLDIGAGRGYDLEIARDVQPDARLFAIEASDPSAEALRELGIDVHGIDIEREPFPFGPESLDLIIANQILEHTKELFWILHQVSTTLKQGGHLLIGVPNLAALHNRILLLAGRQPTAVRSSTAHVRGFTRRDLETFLQRGFPGGYGLTGFAGSNFYPFPPLLARPLARVLPSMAWGVFLDFQKLRPYAREFLEYPTRERLETNFYLGP